MEKMIAAIDILVENEVESEEILARSSSGRTHDFLSYNGGSIPLRATKNKELSQKIYDELFDKPKTHAEWAEGFNIRGKIMKILDGY